MPDQRVTTYQRTLYDRYRREIRSNVIFGIVASVVLFVLAALVFVNNIVLIKVYVSGSSMYPTLKNGDMVILNSYASPDYGDIIVISGEKENGDWLIKRAIAFGGDTVKIENDRVYLKRSGETEFTLLNETYLAKNVNTRWDANNTPAGNELTVGEDQIFYLGDNRTNSRDSRAKEFGTCGKDQIVGVVSEFAVKIRGVNTFLDKLFSPLKKLIGN